MTVTEFESLLRLISPIGVIVSAAFVVIQLRMNAAQAKSRTAFDLIGKVVDPSFPARRHRLYEVAETHAHGDWNAFDHSLDDFEVRNFANVYEQIGLLVKKGVIDLKDVMDALSAQPMADWRTFQPIREHIIEEAAKAFPVLAANRAGIDALTGHISSGSRKRTRSG